MRENLSKYNEKELLDLCEEKLEYLRRDKEYLEEHGIKVDNLYEFESKINKFKDMPDETDLKNIILTTERNKKNVRMELVVLLRNIETKAKYAWGEYSKQLQDFQLSKINAEKDIELLLFSRAVRVSTDIHFNNLIPFGFTKTIRDRLLEKNNEFYVSLTNTKRAMKFKEATLVKRNAISMDLVETLIKYCDIAKTSSQLHNSKHIDDYLLDNLL